MFKLLNNMIVTTNRLVTNYFECGMGAAHGTFDGQRINFRLSNFVR